MKASAITRIIIYSLVIILLLGILLVALGADLYMFRKGSGVTQNSQRQGSVGAELVKNLSIDWAAGTITLTTADTDNILIQETGEIDEKYIMEYEIDGSTLEIAFAEDPVVVGFGSMPEKDLLITVPKDWTCDELELDAAAVEVNIQDVIINRVNCDGAALSLKMDVSVSPLEIDVDGAGCKIDITMPSQYGYFAEMDGLGCEFNSNVEYTAGAGSYFYAGRDCKVYVDGLGCELTINLND